MANDPLKPNIGTVGGLGQVARPNLPSKAFSADAMVIDGAAKLLAAGVSLGRGIYDYLQRQEAEADVSDFLGNFDTASEAQAHYALNKQGNVPQMAEDIDTLSEIAIARDNGQMSTSEANARALNLLSEAKKLNPDVAPQLEKAYSTFFGGSLGMDTTAEEKLQAQRAQAIEAGIQKAMTEASSLNMGTSDLMSLNRNVKGMNAQKSALDLKVKKGQANAQDVAMSAEIAANVTGMNIITDVLKSVDENGSLTPDAMKAVNNTLSMAEIKIQREALKQVDQLRASGRNVDMQAIQQRTETAIANLRERVKAVTEDNSLAKLLKDNNDIIGAQLDFWAIEAAPEFAFIRKVYGDDGARKYFEYAEAAAEGNTAYMEALKRDPVLKGAMSFLFDEETGEVNSKKVRKLMLNGTKMISGNIQVPNRMTREEAFGVTQALTNREGSKQFVELSKEDLDRGKEILNKAMKQSPEALGSYMQAHWKGKPRDVSVPLIQASVDGVSSTVRGQIIANDQVLEDIRVPVNVSNEDPNLSAWSGRVESRPTRMQKVGLDIRGDVDGDVKAHINQIYNVAKEYPELWEGKFDTPVDYVRAQFRFSPLAKEGEDE